MDSSSSKLGKYVMELAMPEVEELFPVELKVEAALEDWLNSESSLSSVLKEFLEVFIIIFFWLKC